MQSVVTKRALLAATLILGCAGAHAVPYALPSTAEQPFAQLQPMPGGETLCATWLEDGECDVPPGTYRLLTYDPAWKGAPARFVVVERPSDTAGMAAELAAANTTILELQNRVLDLEAQRQTEADTIAGLRDQIALQEETIADLDWLITCYQEALAAAERAR